MRNKIIIVICCLSSLSLKAQYDGKDENIASRFRPGFMWFYTGVRPAKVEKPRKYDRLIFDVTYNDWNGDRNLFQNTGLSIGLNTNLMFDVPITLGNTIALGIGVSHQYISISHGNHLVKNETDRTTTYSEKTDLDAFKKSQLSGNNFAIPIELRFRKESWRHLKFHVGGKIGYQANLYNKYVVGSGNSKDVVKNYGFFDQNELTYSAHVRVGLRNWALFGSYNFNPLFSNVNSTQLNLVQLGLSISLY